jgi:hypothetical protein
MIDDQSNNQPQEPIHFIFVFISIDYGNKREQHENPHLLGG